MVPDFLVGKARGRHDFDDMESSPRHVEVVERREVGELLECVGFGVWVCGFDLAADLVEGFGDKSRLADELEAEALD